MTSNGNTNIDASLKSDSANKSETGLKRTVLCYGDSNTWGYIPGTEMQRYSAHVRWPGVLSKLLGNEYRVQEEGLNGRTVASDDPLAFTHSFSAFLYDVLPPPAMTKRLSTP